MRILVQNCMTNEFVGPQGVRTRDSTAAHAFTSTLAALEFCHELKNSDLQIVMKFDREEFDVTLPISGSCKELTGI